MFPPILMLLPMLRGSWLSPPRDFAHFCERSGPTTGIFPVSKSVGPRCEGRKLNVYRFITLEAMRKRHKDAVQDWVLLI